MPKEDSIASMSTHELVVTKALTPACATMGAATATVIRSCAESRPKTFLQDQRTAVPAPICSHRDAPARQAAKLRECIV